MGTYSQMMSAIDLADKLDQYVLSAECRPRYTRTLATVRGVLEAGPPTGTGPEEVGDQARFIAVDTMLFERSSPGSRTLIECYLAGSPALTIAERQVLAGWCDGGVLGVFEILAVRDTEQEIVARHVGNGRRYRLVLAPERYVEPPRMRPRHLLSGRALPVGDRWLLHGMVCFWPRAAGDEPMAMARDCARIHPASMFHEPALLERGRSLVAAQHETFRRLFGADVVEGSVAEIHEAAERFLARLGWGPESDWAPVKDTMRRIAELRDASRERAGAGEEADHEEGHALVHHRVGGLRVVGRDYRLAETAHRSSGVEARSVATAMRGIIERGDLPWFVLRDLADRYPRRARELYRAALRRPDFDLATDLDQVLRRREPGADPGRPGIAVLPPVGEPVRSNRRLEAA